MQTILGAGGAIGTDLAKELKKYTDKIRLVGRNPKAVNPTDELYTADLSDPSTIDKAVQGTDIVYVTIGFKYTLQVWRSAWPAFIKSTIDACEKYGAKLVFFDNVYMYDVSAIPHMTEESPMNPISKKGAVRKQLVDMILEAVKAGRIQAVIARAADFYGPKNETSVLIETVYKPLKQGKRSNLLASGDKKHSYTYTPDAAKATALLGNTPDVYNQVWHLPTAPPITQKEFVILFAKEMGKVAKYTVTYKWFVKILGLFIPIMKELYEMLYQYDRDYNFDSSKFEKRFNVKPTSYQDGVREIVRLDNN